MFICIFAELIRIHIIINESYEEEITFTIVHVSCNSEHDNDGRSAQRVLQ